MTNESRPMLRPGVSLRTVGLATEHRPAGCVATGTVSLRSTREQPLSVGAKGERPPDRASRPARRARARRLGPSRLARRESRWAPSQAAGAWGLCDALEAGHRGKDVGAAAVRSAGRGEKAAAKKRLAWLEHGLRSDALARRSQSAKSRRRAATKWCYRPAVTGQGSRTRARIVRCRTEREHPAAGAGWRYSHCGRWPTARLCSV